MVRSGSGQCHGPELCSFPKFNMKLINTIRRVATALAGLTLAAAAVAADDNEVVLVRFANTEKITAQDLSDYLDRRVDLRSARRNAWGVQTILREMAMTRALGLEGDAMDVPQLAERKSMRFDDIYSNAVFKKLAKTCEPLADAAAARKYFDENPGAFRVPPMARLSRVMLPTTEKVDGVPAADWLMQQAQAIASGKQKMEDAAKRAETVHKFDAQGDIGWVTLTDDVQILRALASAKQGDMVGPVREGDFVYLFTIEAKRESRPLTWDEAAMSVPTRALNLCRQEASDDVREQMFKKYGVQLDESAIKELFSEKSLKESAENQKKLMESLPKQ